MESCLQKYISLLEKVQSRATRLVAEITQISLWDITNLQEIKMFVGLEDIDHTTFFTLSLSGVCTCLVLWSVLIASCEAFDERGAGATKCH